MAPRKDDEELLPGTVQVTVTKAGNQQKRDIS